MTEMIGLDIYVHAFNKFWPVFYDRNQTFHYISVFGNIVVIIFTWYYSYKKSMNGPVPLQFNIQIHNIRINNY